MVNITKGLEISVYAFYGAAFVKRNEFSVTSSVVEISQEFKSIILVKYHFTVCKFSAPSAQKVSF